MYEIQSHPPNPIFTSIHLRITYLPTFLPTYLPACLHTYLTNQQADLGVFELATSLKAYYTVGRPSAPSVWRENGPVEAAYNGVAVREGSAEEAALIETFEDVSKTLNDRLNRLFNYRKCDFAKLLRRQTLDEGAMISFDAFYRSMVRPDYITSTI